MKLEEKISKIPNIYYQNSDLTSENFPEPKTLRTDYKTIEMKKSFSSQEALDEMKKQGCSPANIWELTEWIAQGNAKKGKWYPAFGSSWKDSDGFHRVPIVDALTDGDFEFVLGYFESDWNSGNILVCFCDSLDTQTLEVPSTQSLMSFEQALEIVKANNCRVYQTQTKTITTEVEL